jgi:hypothetical protein
MLRRLGCAMKFVLLIEVTGDRGTIEAVAYSYEELILKMTDPACVILPWDDEHKRPMIGKRVWIYSNKAYGTR